MITQNCKNPLTSILTVTFVHRGATNSIRGTEPQQPLQKTAQGVRNTSTIEWMLCNFPKMSTQLR